MKVEQFKQISNETVDFFGFFPPFFAVYSVIVSRMTKNRQPKHTRNPVLATAPKRTQRAKMSQGTGQIVEARKAGGSLALGQKFDSRESCVF